MKYFRTTTDPGEERHKISWENFTEFTEQKPPYVQDYGGKESYYAVCPNCKNPIQLIGLARKSSRDAYGKHAGKTIDGLRPWNQMKYEYCFLGVKGASRNPEDDEEDRFLIIDDDVINLYNLFKNQFDQVVYSISEKLGIYANENFWRRALKKYLANKAYCYIWLSDANLPLAFAQFGLQYALLWKVKIKQGSPLYVGLSACPNISFSDPNDYGYCSWKPESGNLYLSMRFYNHKYRAAEKDELIEYLQFCIDDRTTNKTLFETKLQYRETEFQEVCKSRKNKRQQWLLKIANEEMKEDLKKQN